MIPRRTARRAGCLPRALPGIEPKDASRVDQYPAWEYVGGMKIKTSVTLSPETLNAIDEIAGELLNRSRVIELAVLEFIDRRRRADRDARDLEILNRSADGLNEEVEDILGYQVEL